MVGFLSNLKEAKQLRRVLLTHCRNLSPSLMATICEGLCSNNSMEEVMVTLEVRVLSVCIATLYKRLSSVRKLSLKTIIYNLKDSLLTDESCLYGAMRYLDL